MGSSKSCHRCKREIKDGEYYRTETETHEVSVWDSRFENDYYVPPKYSGGSMYDEYEVHYCWKCIQKEEEQQRIEEQKRQEQQRLDEQERQKQRILEELKKRDERRSLVTKRWNKRQRELQELLSKQKELDEADKREHEIQDVENVTKETQAMFRELMMQEYKHTEIEKEVERNLTTFYNSRCSPLEYTVWKNNHEHLSLCSQFSMKEKNVGFSESLIQSRYDQFIFKEKYEEVLHQVMDLEISSKFPNHRWLITMQSYLVYSFCLDINLDDIQADILLDAVSCIAINLSDQECTKLTKALASLCIASEDIDEKSIYSFKNHVLQYFLRGLICGCRDQGFYSGACVTQCIHRYLHSCEEGVHYDKTLLQMIAVNADAILWCVFYNVDRAICNVDQPHSIDLQLLKQKLHLIQTYNVPYYAHDWDLKDLQQFKFRPSKCLKSIMHEFCQLNGSSDLEELRKVLFCLSQLELTKACQETCDECLKHDREKMVEALERIQQGGDPAVEDIVLVLRILSYAFYKYKKYMFMPRKTQLLSVCILLLSKERNSSLLLEVLTGEGKSSIIAMFATALALTGKKVDIITSSPVLARRDVKNWTEFYQFFDLSVDHNTETPELLQLTPSGITRKRAECYQSSIVYGTVSSFSADALRQRFEMKEVRSHRKPAVAIVDEVDMLMLDEGVNFTYLSHQAAVLRHVEPVLAMVWSAVAQNTPLCTVNGDVLFAGVPKSFHTIIYEAIEKIDDNFKHQTEILQFLLDICVVNLKHQQALTMLLESQNVESEKVALAMLNLEDLTLFIRKLNEIIPLKVKAYVYTEQNNLKVVTEQGGAEEIVSVLVCDNGILCPLYCQEDLSQGIKAMISSKCDLPNEGLPTDNEQLLHTNNGTDFLSSVPCHFDDFISDHLNVTDVLKLSLKTSSNPKLDTVIQFLDSQDNELQCKLIESFTDTDLLGLLHYLEEHTVCEFPAYYTLNNQKQLVCQFRSEINSDKFIQGILVLDKGMLCPLFAVTPTDDTTPEQPQQDCCKMIMEKLLSFTSMFGSTSTSDSMFDSTSLQARQFQSQEKRLHSVDGQAFVCGIADYFHNVITQYVNPKQLLSLLKGADDQGQKTVKMIEDAKLIQKTLIATDLLPIINSTEGHFSCNIEMYTQNDQDDLVCVNKSTSVRQDRNGKARPTVRILLSDEGMICKLHPKQIVHLPHSLKPFVANQLPIWISSAFIALKMTENREYILKMGEHVIPVDHLNSGVIEENKRWGGGLQQMLEMKHHLQISPMSIVTNFMSHVEFFQQYTQTGSLFGLSGTVGGSMDAKILDQLYKLKVYKIPTHRHSLLYERDTIFIRGERKEWLEQIHTVVKDVTEPKTYIPGLLGGAALVLCEDIRTAKEIQSYLGGKLCKEPKLYDGEDITVSIEKDALVPGDIIVATNLAGRGTDISVTEDVNNSGGLLCLMTFLPRNRRVELQAFGRTARSGSPGSVQYVLPVSELPCKYVDGLDITTLHELQENREHQRLQQMLETDIKTVKVREELFKKHCLFLKSIHCDEEVQKREDKEVIIDTINENWGQWLQMKQEEIEAVPSNGSRGIELIAELEVAHKSWKYCSNMSSNYYHLIKFGNQRLEDKDIPNEKERAREAMKYYAKAIDQEPNFTMIAHYNHAYCLLETQEGNNYIASSIQDLNKAREQLNVFLHEVALTLQCAMISRHKHTQPSQNNKLLKQMEVRMQVLKYFGDKIDETIATISQFKESGTKFEVVTSSILKFIPVADVNICEELYSLSQLGLEFAFVVKKKPRFCWEALAIFALGVLQIAAGVCISIFTTGALSSFGMGLISEGISDCIDGVVGMVTGEFDLKAWGISKACSIGVAIACGAVTKFISKGTKAIRGASKASSLAKKTKTVVKDLKAMSKVAKGSWGKAMTIQAKNVAKLVGKELVVRGVMYAVGEVENKVINLIFENIGAVIAERLKSSLTCSFQNSTLRDKELGLFVDCKFVVDLPESYAQENRMDPILSERAKKYFTSAAESVVCEYGQRSSFDDITQHIRSLLPQISSHLKLKGNAKLVTAAVLQLSELGFVVDSVRKAVDQILKLTGSFLPALKTHCYESFEVTDNTQTEIRYSLPCIKELKMELAQLSAEKLGEAVKALLLQNLTWIVNRGLSLTINQYAAEKLNEGLHVTETKELIKAGQNANYLRSMPLPITCSDNVDFTVMKYHSDNALDPAVPGTLAELRVAAETFDCKIIIEDKDGNRSCSITSSSREEKPKIVLVHTPPDQCHPQGHYQVKIDGKIIDVSSKNSNCMYEALAHGLSEAKGDLSCHTTGNEVREAVSEEIRNKPHLWHEHFSRKEELMRMKQGAFFLHPGGKGLLFVLI